MGNILFCRATQLTIQLGSNQLQGSDDGRVTITSSTYFYEPRFDPTLGVAHDIALIKIEEPLTFTGINTTQPFSDIYTLMSVICARLCSTYWMGLYWSPLSRKGCNCFRVGAS